MFKNEGDVARRVVEHLLAEGVGMVIIADNGSTDDTRQQIEAIRGPVEIIDDPEPAFYQAAKMTSLARRAESYGADWVLPFDADEVWYSDHGRIADVLEDVDAEVVQAPGWDHMVTPLDPSEAHPFLAMRFRRPEPQSMPKVAFRPHQSMMLEQGNHGVLHPGRRTIGPLYFRHFQWRSFEQFKRKVRQGKVAYDLTDLPEGMGCHWRAFGAMTDEQLEAEWVGLCSMAGLVLDPAPLR